jgi:hypothetical protein
MGKGRPNNSMQPTALCAAADAGRYLRMPRPLHGSHLRRIVRGPRTVVRVVGHVGRDLLSWQPQDASGIAPAGRVDMQQQQGKQLVVVGV